MEADLQLAAASFAAQLTKVSAQIYDGQHWSIVFLANLFGLLQTAPPPPKSPMQCSYKWDRFSLGALCLPDFFTAQV